MSATAKIQQNDNGTWSVWAGDAEVGGDLYDLMEANQMKVELDRLEAKWAERGYSERQS